MKREAGSEEAGSGKRKSGKFFSLAAAALNGAGAMRPQFDFDMEKAPGSMVQTDPDEQFMKKALRLAARGAGMTSPNPLVGAVVVKDGVVVGKGYHQALGGPHAEVNAIADAGAAAKGATLYVTLEPCNHYGLTPPCTKAVVDAGIARVVFGMGDPNPDVAGGGAERLRRAGIEVKGGILERECRELNQSFIKYVTTGLPYVMLKAAATLDGFIATSAGESKWITSELSRQFAHRLRSHADGILVGIGTVIADDPLLTVRLHGKKNRRQPVRIVLDSELKIPLDSQLVRTASAGPVWVVCRRDASVSRQRTLGSAGIHVIRVPSGRFRCGFAESAQRTGSKAHIEPSCRRRRTCFGVFHSKRVCGRVLFFLRPQNPCRSKRGLHA